MKVHLTAKNLFSNYIVDPRSKDLSKKDRRIATLVLTIFCILPPLFLVPLAVLLLNRIDPIDSDELSRGGSSSTASKAHGKGVEALGSKSATAVAVANIGIKVSDLNAHAVKLAKKATKPTANRQLSRGLPNSKSQLKNVCYFNASVQTLEAVLMSQSGSFSNLLKQDLSLQEGETLVDLEERLLKDWAPCEQENAKDRQKAIAFKWSFLLMMQAKQYGSTDELYKAILAHRKVLFQLGTEITADTNGKQLDAAFYFEIFTEKLRISPMSIAHTRINREGDEYVCASDPVSMLQLAVKDRERISLSDLIERNFLTSKLPKPFTPEGSREVYTHERSSLEGEAPPLLFLQLKVFGSKVKQKVEVQGETVVDEDPVLGRVVKHKEKTTVLEFLGAPTFKIKPRLRLDPEEVIDLSEYYGEDPGTYLYELMATCDHSGDLGSGHYTANVKLEDGWHLANDKSNKPQAPSFSNSYIIALKKIS